MENLFINRGSRKLSIRQLDLPSRPELGSVIINVVSIFMDIDEEGFGEEEIEDATFYLHEEDIDPIIEKLKEAKKILKETRFYRKNNPLKNKTI